MASVITASLALLHVSSGLDYLCHDLGSSSEVCWLVVCGAVATGDDETEFEKRFLDLA